jgi:serine/threonine-protein kinase
MSEDPLVGKTLGPCRIEALVGRGGMGRVYRARHVALDRVVALKLVDQSASAALRDAVLAEARAAAKLEDPRIVAVYEVGEDRGLPYIVMQWVDGEGLDVLVRRAGPLTPQAALTALCAAHAAGLVHCDVKPPNILVDARGGVRLADFGLARQTGSARSPDERVTGSFHFMSPEQGLGAHPDPRSDLYAVGSTWYFALTGQLLFPGSAMDALLRHREEMPPDVRLLRPEVTEKCAALIRRLLDKDPAKRPPDAETVLREMTAVGMLLETDSSGSPFRILPAPPPPGPEGMAAMTAPSDPDASGAWEERTAAPATTRAPKPPAPLPPPAAPAPALGSRTTFFAIFAVLGLIAVGWPWRRAVAEDWVAGTAFLAAFSVFLTFGNRRAIWRKPAGVALWAASLGCLARHVDVQGPVPPLETMIVAAIGGLSAGGAVYMGLWGTDVDDVKWARGLAPAGGLLLAVAALTWSVPEGRGWTEVLSSEGARVWRAWWAAGGAWRWGGLAALGAAAAAARRMKPLSERPAEGRNLNWNR